MEQSKGYKEVFGLDVYTGSNADIERQVNRACKFTVLHLHTINKIVTLQEVIDNIRDTYVKGRRTYFTMVQIQTQHRREALVTLASYRTNIRYLEYCIAHGIKPAYDEEPAILNRYKDYIENPKPFKPSESQEHAELSESPEGKGRVLPEYNATILMNLVGLGLTSDEAHVAIGVLQGAMDNIRDEGKKVFSTTYIFSDGSKIEEAYILKDLLNLASKGVSLISCNVQFLTSDGRIGEAKVTIDTKYKSNLH